MIEVKDVTKTYGGNFSLDNINLTFYPGDVVGIIGPNGAGKTTLIRSISGFVKPDIGEILINNINVTNNPISIKKQIGIVETENYLYPKLTLEDHLLFIKNIKKINDYDYEQNKAEIYSLLNFTIEPYVRIETLSHGNKKKSMLAAAFISDPEILLLDEPLNGIDPVSSRKIKDYLKHLALDKNKTIIISSHAIESLEKYCDRIIIIKEGRILDDIDVQKMMSDNVDLEEYFINKITSL